MEVARRPGYSGITLGAVLIMAFVFAQPTMNNAYAVGIEGLPDYDDCSNVDRIFKEDPISMNTVRSGNIVKTIHAEKETDFRCHLDQGNLNVIVDLTTYIEIYENIADREVIETNAISVTCIKDAATGIIIDCESNPVPATPVFVGSDCFEYASFGDEFTHPQEMNSVNKGNIAKTIEAQKEAFVCTPTNGISKKVDIVIFTDTYENLATHTVEEVQFHSMRCVVLLRDSINEDARDATVEGCQFKTIPN